MAGITITEDGEVRRYELKRIFLEIKETSPTNKVNLFFDVFNDTTDEKLWSYQCSLSDTAANTFYTQLKSIGISYAYVSLCTEKGITSSGVPLDMDSEVIE